MQRRSGVSAIAGSPAALVSGAADSTIIVWLWFPDRPEKPWLVAAKLKVRLGSTFILIHCVLLLFITA